MNQLKKIEKEMETIITKDKQSWADFYVLLHRVETEKLWKENYNSFTQWVKDFSVRNKTHESIIWNRKKAGEVYNSYYKKQKEKGIEVVPIQEANVSMDSLVLLDKINKYNPQKSNELVEKVMNRGITKQDLREVYKSIRPKNISTNPHLKQIEPEQENHNKNNKITTQDIVTTLFEIEWISKKKIERKYFKTGIEKDRYKCLTEFPVYTGTSRKSRRIDALIVENITTENVWELNLHGVEIKISKSDLTNDMKYTEYGEFVDFLWLAIPIELLGLAKENKPTDCGVIVFKKENGKIKAEIAVIAKKINAIRREDTLTTLALKLM